MQAAKGIVLGPHARTPAATSSEWRTPTACAVAGQPEGNEHQTSNTPRKDTGRPPGGRPPTTSTARNASSQKRTQWG